MARTGGRTGGGAGRTARSLKRKPRRNLTISDLVPRSPSAPAGVGREAALGANNPTPKCIVWDRQRLKHLPPTDAAIRKIGRASVEILALTMQPWSRPLRRALPEASPSLQMPRRCNRSELPSARTHKSPRRWFADARDLHRPRGPKDRR
jgi:hypothetical protein